MVAYELPQVMYFTQPNSLAGKPWGVGVLLTNLTRPTSFYPSSTAKNRVVSISPGTTRQFGKFNWEYFDDTITSPTLFSVIPASPDLYGSMTPVSAVNNVPMGISAYGFKAIDVSSVLNTAGQWDTIHAGTQDRREVMYLGSDDASAVPVQWHVQNFPPTQPTAMPNNKTFEAQEKGVGLIAMQRFHDFPLYPSKSSAPVLFWDGNETSGNCWYQVNSSGNTQAFNSIDGSDFLFAVFRGGANDTKIKVEINGLAYSVPNPTDPIQRLARLPSPYCPEAFEVITSSYALTRGAFPSHWNSSGQLDQYNNNLLGKVLSTGFDALTDWLLPGELSSIAKQVKNMLMGSQSEPAIIGVKTVPAKKEVVKVKAVEIVDDKKKGKIKMNRGSTSRQRKLNQLARLLG